MNDEDRPMPPLIAFAGALGGLAVVRWAYRTALRVNRELEEARLARVAEAARSNEIPTLRRDPNTGAYRPGWGRGLALAKYLRRPQGGASPIRTGEQLGGGSLYRAARLLLVTIRSRKITKSGAL